MNSNDEDYWCNYWDMSLENAILMGISITEYDDITPRQLSIVRNAYMRKKNDDIEEYKLKIIHQQDLMTRQAYYISRWVWAKKLDLKDVLPKPKQEKNMTDEAMLNQVKLLNTLFGGEIKTNGKE